MTLRQWAVQQAPDGLITEPADLVVLSEFLYYLDPRTAPPHSTTW